MLDKYSITVKSLTETGHPWRLALREWFILLAVGPCGISVLVGGSLLQHPLHVQYIDQEGKGGGAMSALSRALRAPWQPQGWGPKGRVTHRLTILHYSSPGLLSPFSTNGNPVDDQRG